MAPLQRCCSRIIRSPLALIALTLIVCVTVDKGYLAFGAGNSAVGGGSGGGRWSNVQLRHKRPNLSPQNAASGASSDNNANDVRQRIWVANLLQDVSNKEPDAEARQQPPDERQQQKQSPSSSSPARRLVHLLRAASPPRYALDGPKPAAACAAAAEGQRPLVLIWVYSAPGNFEARARVRRTWGAVSSYEGYNLSVAFFVGDGGGGGDRLLLRDESEAHGDIVQDVAYVDSYANLSLKGASGLRWLAERCPSGAFAVKVDDDTLVSPFALVRYLRSPAATPAASAAAVTEMRRSLTCKVQLRARPQRLPDKWFEDPADYPDVLYPTYCQGFAYIFSMDVARLLAAAVGKTRVPRMEDVYVTGVLPKFVGIGHRPIAKGLWMVTFQDGFEKAVDRNPHVIFISDTFITARVDYFWTRQKEFYNWKR